MEKGLCKDWTPEMEVRFQRRLAGARTWAERHAFQTICNLIRYDLRTTEAKKARARLQLDLVVATDQDLRELAELEKETYLADSSSSIEERLEELINGREAIKARGIPEKLIARGESGKRA